IAQKHWTENTGWQAVSTNGFSGEVQLALVFGDIGILRQDPSLREVRQLFPKARIVGCSTAGEIIAGRVFDETLTATGVFFQDTRLQFAQTIVIDMEDSFNAGTRLAEALDPNGLVHVFVVSDGVTVNGSALVKGLRNGLPVHVAVTGGLAGDQDRFKETLVFLDEVSDKKTIVAIGFYGDSLRIGYGSRGGWGSFGPDRLVTRSRANVVYELDGQSVLQLYRKYLGEQADGLPVAGLQFPLSLALDNCRERLVRTVQSINDSDGSMTFAGDVPQGSLARLMRANLQGLIDGAADSANQSQVNGSPTPSLAMLISCVGRKLVLKQRVDEEVESVQEALGTDTAITGFYSYGEICPVDPGQTQAEFHNQTMTITTFSEQLTTV
ncbi:MAG: FIST signal transduction protein, partial [Solirubrobacterales bacterium]